MDKFLITGGIPLHGHHPHLRRQRTPALPCMAAAILTEDEIVLENIPQGQGTLTPSAGCWHRWARKSIFPNRI